MNGSHADRIIELLRVTPGLDDDEISACTGIRPRQAVNQVCRRLESRGILVRVRGARGKIVNRLAGGDSGPTGLPSGSMSRSTPQPASPTARAVIPREGASSMSAVGPLAKNQRSPIACSPSSTLFILPCSGRKHTRRGCVESGPRITDHLPQKLAESLRRARAEVRSRAGIDESTLIPAWERYGGYLYQEANKALELAVAAGYHVLILSGAYGVVLATEPIGTYNATFTPSWWPKGLLERVLELYAARYHLQIVRALASETTAYRRIVERVNWRRAGVKDMLLLIPATGGPGGMVKAPRAQGQAFAAFVDGSISLEWSSSDGIGLRSVDCLCQPLSDQK